MSTDSAMPRASLIKPLVGARLEQATAHDLQSETTKFPYARSSLLGEWVVAHHLQPEATKIPYANSGLLGAW